MADSKKHVLYVAEFSTGGSIESLLTLLGGLKGGDFKTTVLFHEMPDDAVRARVEETGTTVASLRRRQPDAHPAPKQLPKFNLQGKVRKMFGRGVERIYASLKYALYYARFRRSVHRQLRDKIRELGPDLVHMNTGVATDTAAIRAARDCRVPIVCHVRDLDSLTRMSVSAARHVDRFVCISSAVSANLVDFGAPPDRCVVVPNAVNLDRFSRADRPAAEIRAEFGWSASQDVFALVGRVVSWKGHDEFIDAVAKSAKTNPNIRGLIVGGAESTNSGDRYMAHLRTKIDDRMLQGIVEFAGHRSDVPDIMQAADAVVCPSSAPEPFGRVIIESMAAGTPVIATKAGGTTDIIEDGVNGLLVANKDSDALAEAMLRISSDFELQQEFRSAGLSTVQDRYTVARHVERVSDVYRSIFDVADK